MIIMENKQICRACLTAKDSFIYFLYDNVSPDMYSFCTSVQVYQDENYPRTLCNSCYSLLVEYHKFKTTCIESQKILSYRYMQYNTENSYTNDIKTEEIESQHENKLEVSDINIKHEIPLANEYLDAVDVDLPDSPEETKVKVKKRIVKKLKKLKQVRKPVPPKLVYTCDVCNKKFKYQERFEAHKQEHEGILVPFSCLPCNKTFVSWGSLKRHKDSEHTQVPLKSLKCHKCGKIFKSQQTLKMHIKLHCGERKMIVCHICGKELSVKYLQIHLETHKNTRERRFTCEHCGKKFFTKTMLMSHVSKLHTGRRYICQICSLPFTDKHNLAKHLIRHEGTKLYKCDICTKAFGTQFSLVEHKRLHSGERPFVCSYCPKAFVSKRRLIDHVRIHTGEKPHKCVVCGRSFIQRGTLKRHMKVHDR